MSSVESSPEREIEWNKPETSVNIVHAIARTIDDALNSVIGVRILEPIVDGVEDVLPANLVRTLSGIPKPSEIFLPAAKEAIDKGKERVTGVLPRR